MKICLIGTTAILYSLFLSCSKSNSKASNVPMVTFMANDTAYTMPHNGIPLVVSGNTSYYLLNADDSRGNAISLEINSPKIIVGSYSSEGECDFNFIHYTSTNTTLTITNVHNGLADGTFVSTQNQENPAGNGKVIITNGVFKNVLFQQ